MADSFYFSFSLYSAIKSVQRNLSVPLSKLFFMSFVRYSFI